MGTWLYEAKSKEGRKISGNVEAASEGEARTKLRLMGHQVAKIHLKGGSPGGGKKGPSLHKKNASKGDIDLNKLFQFITPKSVSGQELAIITRQLSTMIDSGVTIVQALEMLASQAENPRVREVLTSVRESIEGGLELNVAMSKYPDVFNDLYCSLVQAGNASGQLDVMMRRLSVYIEKANKLVKQLKSALTYPIVVIALAILLSVGMLTFVVPMFSNMFKESGKELPALTQMIVTASDFIRNYWYFMLAGVIASWFTFLRWKSTDAGHYQWDGFLLRMPIFGNLIRKIAIARFTSTMSVLTASGIAIIEALTVCSKAAGNIVIEREIIRIREDVAKGKGLAGPISRSDLFPKMVSGMVAIGEASGQLDTMLAKIAYFYEEEVDAAMAQALKAIEPLMFVVIGGIIGVILIAMYLPIFELAGTMSGG